MRQSFADRQKEKEIDNHYLRLIAIKKNKKNNFNSVSSHKPTQNLFIPQKSIGAKRQYEIQLENQQTGKRLLEINLGKRDDYNKIFYNQSYIKQKEEISVKKNLSVHSGSLKKPKTLKERMLEKENAVIGQRILNARSEFTKLPKLSVNNSSKVNRSKSGNKQKKKNKPKQLQMSPANSRWFRSENNLLEGQEQSYDKIKESTEQLNQSQNENLQQKQEKNLNLNIDNINEINQQDSLKKEINGQKENFVKIKQVHSTKNKNVSQISQDIGRGNTSKSQIFGQSTNIQSRKSSFLNNNQSFLQKLNKGKKQEVAVVYKVPKKEKVKKVLERKNSSDIDELASESEEEGIDNNNEVLLEQNIKIGISFLNLQLFTVIPQEVEEEKYYCKIKIGQMPSFYTDKLGIKEFENQILNYDIKYRHIAYTKNVRISVYQEKIKKHEFINQNFKQNQQKFAGKPLNQVTLLGDIIINLKQYYRSEGKYFLHEILRLYREIVNKPNYMSKDLRDKGKLYLKLDIESEIEEFLKNLKEKQKIKNK
ncbi:hypothetical protein PPERSA_06082 [Pseudocohnilembus persalinus]|uniref:Uncharacterized protein n=1 Tax=Pseudocohnilembus persalinus TaxID=266149 RepID=A0A0V0QW82_PSEPJ|nr:hypothetical protein PPERSA_06082 [Pseudocohnilembus persalinus]|eukprot:KRX06200.1 hypothetical protein PPERSA_06082 [Pseudocohnilembus persalinus]